MKIGVPTEVKNNENRVSLTPAGADRLVHEGHRVLVQSGAGLGSRISDDDYRAVGAEIVATADTTPRRCNGQRASPRSYPDGPALRAVRS